MKGKRKSAAIGRAGSREADLGQKEARVQVRSRISFRGEWRRGRAPEIISVEMEGDGVRRLGPRSSSKVAASSCTSKGAADVKHH